MSKVEFSKPGTTPNQQVNILKSRGIVISDTESAEHYLSYHNYYQVSGYICNDFH